MKRIAALLLSSALIICCGSCSDTSQPDSSVSEDNAASFSSGYDDSDSAYNAFCEACLADDEDEIYHLFSQKEIEACLALTQDKTGMSDTDFKQLSMCFEEKRFKKNISGMMNDIQLSMKNFGSSGDTWSILPGTPSSAGDEKIKGDSDMLGINIEDMNYYTFFFYENKSADASCAGPSCTTIRLDGKWYPSYLYTAAGLVNVYNE